MHLRTYATHSLQQGGGDTAFQHLLNTITIITTILMPLMQLVRSVHSFVTELNDIQVPIPIGWVVVHMVYGFLQSV